MHLVIKSVIMIKLHPIISVVEINTTSLLIYLAFSLLLIQMIYFLIKEQKQILDITLSDVTALDDGSYHVVWGYNNKSKKAIHVDHKESSLLVSQGGILLLSKHPPIHFEKGNHPKVMEMIALDGTEIEWVVKEEKRKVVIDKKIAQYKKGSEMVDE